MPCWLQEVRLDRHSLLHQGPDHGFILPPAPIRLEVVLPLTLPPIHLRLEVRYYYSGGAQLDLVHLHNGQEPIGGNP